MSPNPTTVTLRWSSRTPLLVSPCVSSMVLKLSLSVTHTHTQNYSGTVHTVFVSVLIYLTLTLSVSFTAVIRVSKDLKGTSKL